jgi:uncharacterized membrane protein
LKLSDLKEYAGSRLWIWPLIGLAVTLVAAVGTLYVDLATSTVIERLFARVDVITGDPDAARAILSVIAGSMVSLLVFTFTMTMVVIQLASAQYTPRLMRSVLRDRPTKASLTLFICTFAYALVVLRAVADDQERVVVPELSLAVTYVLVLTSLFTFILYINHVAQTMRVSNMIDRVTEETAALIETLRERARSARGARTPPPSGDHLHGARDLGCPRSGTLSHIDEDALLRLASDRDLVIEVLLRVGDHVPRRSPLARVRGGPIDDHEITDCITLARSRTMQQDIGFGLRQLVDIANRALSPGVNDPTTAVQCIDGLHDLLRELVDHPEMPGALADDDGHGRLIIPRATWDDHVSVATTEIRVSGASSPQIPRRLEAMLRDLHGAAPPERRAVLEHQLRLLEASVASEVELAQDRELFQHPDEQGLGAVTRRH